MKAAISLFAALAAVLAACSTSSTAPAARTSLVSVSPQGGATGVGTTAVVAMHFDHPMATGMPVYASMHQGEVTGPVVACSAAWSSDSMTLTITPMSPLQPGTHYAFHLGGGMRDANGDPIDMTEHGTMMGGEWADQGMMTGGGMMNPGHDEMGPGWEGGNGHYGMVFGFTTA